MSDVTMPRLSDTMEEGTIASWLKQPGEAVARGDVIAPIETDKATMDLTAFEAGTLQEILAPAGSTVPIGQPVARIGNDKATSAPAPKANPPGAEATKSVTPETPEAKENVAEAPEPTAAPEQQPVAPARTEPDRADEGASANGKMRASPMARHIAAE